MKTIVNIIYCKVYQCKNVSDNKQIRAVGLIVLQLFLASVFILLSYKTKAQARITINNDAYLTMDGGIFFVIDNNNSNAITTAGTGGNIITEDEDNKVRWIIKDTTGVYTIPFSDTNNNKIPIVMKIDTAGIGSNGRVDFSIYPTVPASISNFNSPWPSMVSTLNTGCCTNGAPYTIDRFWLVDANNYIVKPDVTLSFTYIDSEHVAPNTITESNLKAQRFDDGNGEWNLGGGKLFGTVNTATNIISGIQIEALDFFTAWTLVDQSSPLPVKLTSFSTICNNNTLELSWVTASEINNDYFNIEKSNDGINFQNIGTVKGNGNSNQTINYSYMDQEITRKSYYRLKQVDFNGKFEYSNVVISDCKTQLSNIKVFPNPSTGNFQIDFGVELISAKIFISNILGEIIYNREVSTQNQMEVNLTSFSKGIYYLTIISAGEKQVKKLIKN